MSDQDYSSKMTPAEPAGSARRLGQEKLMDPYRGFLSETMAVLRDDARWELFMRMVTDRSASP